MTDLGTALLSEDVTWSISGTKAYLLVVRDYVTLDSPADHTLPNLIHSQFCLDSVGNNRHVSMTVEVGLM